MHVTNADTVAEKVSYSTDSRWLLACRIVHSGVLGRSTQLPRLLLYLCRMAISGHAEQISEQRVGIDVFRRSPNYDPGVDGIVRSHASRLRQRLEEYFESAGRDEPLVLQIRRGGYVPVFVPRQRPDVQSVTVQADAAVEDVSATAEQRVLSLRRTLLAVAAGFVSAVLCGILLFAIGWVRWTPAGSSAMRQSRTEERFWQAFLSKSGKTYIVPGDSALVLYETALRREITLADYTSGNYRNADAIGEVYGGVTKQYVAELANRRYTSIVDLRLATQLTHLPEWSAERDSIVFARDLTPAEAQNSNLILIGSLEANPWGALIEPEMNFVLESDGMGGFNYRNRIPKPGEAHLYMPTLASGSQGASLVYGDVAYLPNPSGVGHVLMLSGTWMAGTQAAGNLVQNSQLFSRWLESIAHPDGTIPSFELLVQASSIQGSANQISILASRVDGK